MKGLHSFVAEKNLNTKETPIQTSRPLVIFAVASTGWSRDYAPHRSWRGGGVAPLPRVKI